MTFKTSFTTLAAVICFAATANAQSLATFGSAEAAGLGESSALLGVSMSSGASGWGPVGTLIGQTYRFSSGANTFAQAYAVSPSVGVQNNMPTGSIQASVGYTFIHTDLKLVSVPATDTPSPLPILGVETGSSNGVFISGQGNYWGTGENTAQVIASYGFGAEYYWTRFRAAHRLAPSDNPFYVGAEFVLQGTQKTTPSAMRYQVGPTLEYRVTPDFRVGVSGGYRGGNNNAPGSGYVRIEFLALSRMSTK